MTQSSSIFISKNFIKNLPSDPGVYLMYNADEVIYVGKAKNLKNRVSSYFANKTQEAKTSSLVKQITKIEVIITPTENDALLLESNLIKKHHPRYNIVLRDDKSYPYIFVATAADFPRIDLYRGRRVPKTGRYFGPYPSVYAIRETLKLMQKIFKIRSCRDSFFANRSRPCLQYQINRCSAPCVNFIDKKTYQDSVNNALKFLEGKSQDIIAELEQRMLEASDKLNFEQAAQYRDQIGSLRKAQQPQHITYGSDDIDIIAVATQQNSACVQLLNVRDGQLSGSHNFFPSVPETCDTNEIISAFISQYYSSPNHINSIPSTIIVPDLLSDSALISQLLTKLRGKNCKVKDKVIGIRAKWQEIAYDNAVMALGAHLAARSNFYQRFLALQQLFNLDSLPQRLECFDVSHSSGEATVASCVVFDNNGPLKSAYRKFNIKNITAGDDYAAMKQVLMRHYTRLKADEANLPDILFVDGGKGQVTQALQVLEELQIVGLLVVGVAKGPQRKPGFETLIMGDTDSEITLAPDSPALHLIQQLRDEAHRFAISSHRQQRDKKRTISTLEQIEGVGAKRRQALYSRFGGLHGVKQATVEELQKVKGISRALAEKIYDIFHE